MGEIVQKGELNDHTSSCTDDDSYTDLLINSAQNRSNTSSGDLENQNPLRIKV